jgi:hypothetical protein
VNHSIENIGIVGAGGETKGEFHGNGE